MVAPEYGTVRVTTLPPTAGLAVSVRLEDETVALAGYTNGSGAFTVSHDLDPNTLVALIIENDEKTLIHWRGPVGTLNPMECLLVDRGPISHDEAHRRWRKAYADRMAQGVKNPDPEDVGRKAFIYE